MINLPYLPQHLKFEALIFAAQVLKLVGDKRYRPGVGGSPQFELPEQPSSYLLQIATIVSPDGKYNGHSPHAENFAICLAHSRQFWESLKLFKEIVGDSSKILIADKGNPNLPFQEVAGRSKQLGYEGLFQYARMAKECGEIILAKQLFLMLINETPTRCFPIRLQDIRVASLVELIAMGVKSTLSGGNTEDELTAAKQAQY